VCGGRQERIGQRIVIGVRRSQRDRLGGILIGGHGLILRHGRLVHRNRYIPHDHDAGAARATGRLSSATTAAAGCGTASLSGCEGWRTALAPAACAAKAGQIVIRLIAAPAAASGTLDRHACYAGNQARSAASAMCLAIALSIGIGAGCAG
jgi:hypothetical protein